MLTLTQGIVIVDDYLQQKEFPQLMLNTLDIVKFRRKLSMSCKYELIITRTFDAPKEILFRMWTDSKNLSNWWALKGFRLDVIHVDLRPNEMLLYKQTSSEGQVIWGKYVYKEIVEPDKLVFTNSFSDEEGRTVRAPFYSSWPLEIMNTLTFQNQGDKTTLTIRGIPVTICEEELDTFKNKHEGIKQTFAESFDQLDTYLKEVVY